MRFANLYFVRPFFGPNFPTPDSNENPVSGRGAVSSSKKFRQGYPVLAKRARKSLRRTLLALLTACFLLTNALNGLPALAEGNPSPQSEEYQDFRLGQLKMEQVRLQVEEGVLIGLEQQFKFSAEPDGANSEEKQRLDEASAKLNAEKEKLDQELQPLAKKLREFAVAEKVQAGLNSNEYRFARYDRLGYSPRIVSDCTWYAAEALFVASGGKINLNDRNSVFGNWGNAGNWATYAEAFAKASPGGPITGVNKVPQAGDIVVWPDHVAFVEKVREVQNDQGQVARYILTLSEELATGVPRPNSASTPITPPGDESKVVKRWRSRLELDAKDGKEVTANLRFIHFNL
jgi:surface antigen